MGCSVTDPTFTPELMRMLIEEAEAARIDLEALPEGSQPFWYRNREKE